MGIPTNLKIKTVLFFFCFIFSALIANKRQSIIVAGTQPTVQQHASNSIGNRSTRKHADENVKKNMHIL